MAQQVRITWRDGGRLDRAVQEYLKRLEQVELNAYFVGYMPTRSQIAKWIGDGYVSVNGITADKAGSELRGEALIQITIPECVSQAVEPSNQVTFRVVYQDDDILVVDKPAGLVVHPGAGNRSHTLVNGLVYAYGEHFSSSDGSNRPGIVHRLDKNTSGLMVVAKNAQAMHGLKRQFEVEPRTIHRYYLGVTRRLPMGEAAEVGKVYTIEAPIGRSRGNRTLMSIDTNHGRNAITHWQVKEWLEGGYLLEMKLETGRTHQIRIHLKSVGAPLLGDPEYGERIEALPPNIRSAVRGMQRQALHAWRLEFIHPTTDKLCQFEAPVPEDFRSMILLLGSKMDGF